MSSNPDQPASAVTDVRVRDALASLPEHTDRLIGVCAGPQGLLLHLNRAGRKILGLAPTEPLDTVHLLDRIADPARTAIHELLTGRSAETVWRGPCTLQDNRDRPFALVAIRPPGDTGAEPMLAIIAEKLETAHSHHSGLLDDHNLLHVLLQTVPDSVYFKDLHSRFVRVSHAMAVKLGKTSSEELTGLSDFDMFGIEHAQQAYDDEQRIIRTGKPLINIVEKETWPDGSVTWVSTSKMPLRDAGGNILGTFGISRDITEQKNAEARLEVARKELLEASRLAGMAEIASGVLHNIGNGLNSVNTSVSLLAEQLKRSRLPNLRKAVALLDEHAADLTTFLTSDDRGRRLPAYLGQLSELLSNERTGWVEELERLRLSIEHIKDIVSMQQNYARASALVEDASPAAMVEEALHISEMSLNRHGIEVRRVVDQTPNVRVSRHKVLQILVNFIRNAKYAMDDSGRTDKLMTISVRTTEKGNVRITVADNGVGIPTENLTRIFNFGFTTRKAGHGFGLHSSANAAKEIGGTIRVESDGPGKGARFTLELPALPTAAAASEADAA